jgi:cytochrome P450
MNDPFGLLTPAMRKSPYPIYARMREEAPVCFAEPFGAFCITRYADVATAFRDPRLSASRSGAFGVGLPDHVRARLAPLVKNLSSWALLLDPPDHTRIRGLITKAFTPRVVRRLGEGIAALTATLVDDAVAAARGGTLDVLRDLAAPLPVIVIGDLLGLPRDDRHRLKEWSGALAAFLGAGRPSLESAERATDAVVAMEVYFKDALAVRRRAPGEDLLSMLVAAEEGGVFLGEQEILSTCAMLLFGGHETTTNLIANGLHALLSHPEELARLRGAPEALMANAVEELLRFESPVQRIGRVAREDIELHGIRIPAGSRVHLFMGAAHRDPVEFPDPDRLDVARTDVRHLGLGMGAHYCVGAALGRMEAQAALSELLRRFPHIRAAYDEPAWTDNVTIRGVSMLPVDVGALFT